MPPSPPSLLPSSLDHHLSSSLPPHSHHPLQGWDVERFLLKGASHRQPYQISLWRMTLFKSRSVTEPLYGGFLSMVRVQWLHTLLGFKHNSCASGSHHPPSEPWLWLGAACSRSPLWECLVLAVCVYGTIHTSPGFLRLRLCALWHVKKTWNRPLV